MKKVFIDGAAGTTGLRIHERLAGRDDLELILLPDEDRKDPSKRKEALNASDVAFLCLPDDAAREAVGLLENPETAVIDTSTAHRVDPDWVYGFPEIGGRREAIRKAKRIANPGCHASGFIALISPLREAGVLSADAALSCFSLTGYSGGGKKMIAAYEKEGRDPLFDAPRQYGLTQKHKHLPEMAAVADLSLLPVFCPIVAPYYAGMEVTVPLFRKDLSCGIETVKEIYAAYYGKGGTVFFREDADEAGFLSAGAYENRDDMEIAVFGNEE
ncbi:MAG: N-acetyl-gamma-glutamyl-phosphate reductase, partial [Clostridia bacterium]|nr:N-acetyl-gamma-glutamyl-phosphate reductase [Clostridia bacterium]